jgi:hypothetical protein
LTDYQAEIARTLAAQRSEDSYLAGGAALHLEPNTQRYSNDLDYFHDSVKRVAEAFAADRNALTVGGHEVNVEVQQPGFLRALVRKGGDSCLVEWVHDTAWRFLPPVADPRVGYRLHPIDLAVNKVLALVGRNEPRDFLDVLHVHAHVLPLGALCWAAAGKDPGYTPLSLLDMLGRRGSYRPEDFERLRLSAPVDLRLLKGQWREALESAANFVRSRPPEEIGCLYWSRREQKFIAPDADAKDTAPHHGRPGGVLPQVIDMDD